MQIIQGEGQRMHHLFQRSASDTKSFYVRRPETVTSDRLQAISLTPASFISLLTPQIKWPFLCLCGLNTTWAQLASVILVGSDLYSPLKKRVCSSSGVSVKRRRHWTSHANVMNLMSETVNHVKHKELRSKSSIICNFMRFLSRWVKIVPRCQSFHGSKSGLGSDIISLSSHSLSPARWINIYDCVCQRLQTFRRSRVLKLSFLIWNMTFGIQVHDSFPDEPGFSCYFEFDWLLSDVRCGFMNQTKF